MVKKLSSLVLLLALTTQAFASGIDTQYGIGQQPMAGSQPVVISNDQSAIPISTISGPVALPTGAATEAKQDTGNASLSSIDGKVATEAKQDTGNASLSSIDTKVSTAAKQDTGNASLASIDGKVSTEAKQDVGNASLSSIDAKVATETTLAAILATHKSASATITQVASSASTVALAASNAARKGLKLYNDSTKDCYVAFAATSSLSAFTIKMAPKSFYEMDTVIYTGAVSGIWDSANGNMLVTEL